MYTCIFAIIMFITFPLYCVGPEKVHLVKDPSPSPSNASAVSQSNVSTTSAASTNDTTIQKVPRTASASEGSRGTHVCILYLLLYSRDFTNFGEICRNETMDFPQLQWLVCRKFQLPDFVKM